MLYFNSDLIPNWLNDPTEYFITDEDGDNVNINPYSAIATILLLNNDTGNDHDILAPDQHCSLTVPDKDYLGINDEYKKTNSINSGLLYKSKSLYPIISEISTSRITRICTKNLYTFYIKETKILLAVPL